MAKVHVAAEVSDALVALLEPVRRRVVCVANDPRIAARQLDRLRLTPPDTLVQFNAPTCFDALAAMACHKIHVFNAHEERGHWGLAADGAPLCDYAGQRAASLTLLFAWWLTPPARAYLASLPPGVATGVISGPLDVPLWCYPDGKWPSVGFLAVSVLRQISLLRTLLGLPPLDLVLFGLTGRYPANAGWSGHDFEFEQRAYRNWLDLSRLDHDGLPLS